MTKTMVLGASPNAYRYSYAATLRLQQEGIVAVPIGINPGAIGNQPITDLTQKPAFTGIHTVSIYLNPGNQVSWYKYIIELKPKRVIFNPGSENPEFYRLLDDADIPYIQACTLVMLANGSY